MADRDDARVRIMNAVLGAAPYLPSEVVYAAADAALSVVDAHIERMGAPFSFPSGYAQPLLSESVW